MWTTPSRPIHRFGPSSTSTPMASIRRWLAGDLVDRRVEGLLVAGAGLAIAAQLADVLARGRLQFAGRRRFTRTTEGLDAPAHAATVGRMAVLRQPLRFAGRHRRSGHRGRDRHRRIGGPYAWLARHRLLAVGTIGGANRSTSADVRSISIAAVLARRPLVLEAGMGDGVAGWSPVSTGWPRRPAPAHHGQGVAGAMPEVGTPSPTPRRPEVLLAAAGERPPYVLVGHSLGEVHARVFADRHRADVAGLVLVDGFSVDLEADWIHPLLGGLRPEYEGQADDFRDLIAGSRGSTGRRRRHSSERRTSRACPSSCSERHGSSHVLTSAPTRRSPTHGRQPMRRSRRGTSGTRSPGVPAISCRPIAPTS